MRTADRIFLIAAACVGALCSFSLLAAPPSPQVKSERGGEAIPPADQLERMMLHEGGVPAEIHQKLVDRLTDEQVIDAMKKGVDALLEKLPALADHANEMHDEMKSIGGKNVKVRAGNEGLQGQLAISMYALLYMYYLTGDERLHFTSPQMADPVKKLCEMETTHTYTLAMQASALALLPNKPEFRAPLKRVRDLLIRGGANRGNYHYFTPEANVTNFGPDDFDNSNSQYGLLGVWAADDAGIEVENAFWKACDAHWRRVQQPDGGWTYQLPSRLLPGGTNDAAPNRNQSTPSMTAAGIASLYVTSERLDSTIRLEPVVDTSITPGLKWIAKDFEHTRLKMGTLLYTAYGLERVGLASGLKYFGKYNWYREAAASIVAVQQRNGLWHENWGGEIPGTCYALLFLARGRSPVLFSKLSYSGPWNARPWDLSHLNRWMTKLAEQNMNWQVVDLDNSEADDWLDGPILLITGSKALRFTPVEIAKIRTFIQSGGMIFSTADGDRTEFTESVKKIASLVVDEGGKPKYEMRELPKDHMLFSNKNELWAPIPNPPRILAMSNGVREIWVHSTVDMGASWQGRKYASADQFNFPANLYRYASGKATLRTKLQPLAIAATSEAATRTINLARLDYAGNWDPEPGAWPRLAKIVKRDARTDLQIKNVKIADLDFKTTPIAHMTGTTGFPVGAGDVAVLKKFLADGGTLIADAAGSSANFKTSFDKLLQQITDKPLVTIPVEGKIYNGSIPDSVAAGKTEYRMFYRITIGNRTTPQLKGVEINGRWAVIYSEEDVTSGLLGTNTWGILGYSADSAVNLARNILLYAADPKAGKD